MSFYSIFASQNEYCQLLGWVPSCALGLFSTGPLPTKLALICSSSLARGPLSGEKRIPPLAACLKLLNDMAGDPVGSTPSFLVFPSFTLFPLLSFVAAIKLSASLSFLGVGAFGCGGVTPGFLSWQLNRAIMGVHDLLGLPLELLHAIFGEAG